ncbi:GTP 3',8-cyclase MoaA [Tahibacter amnicola]|uniref:GTP 3',8-cyclase n=1 Tax=Tahibacter amnicola TaxID=2976241 RepID=A0ABY6BKE8_9GAMM|nr:GTP 3',8-cyclase MoaA [Tahibacter amnicola]UXI70489.1 GTP 3',8-cyclase MoaA [Tahibacter amnicola]
MAVLADRFGRQFPYLRLSLLEACNFRCSYCLPDGYHAAPGLPAPLRIDEIERLLRAFADMGMRKVRLTGGEPTLRKDLPAIVRVAATTPGVSTVAMTTNGCLLRRRWPEWRAAGLTALNVSVDTLDRARFAQITGHDRLDDICAGIDEAVDGGFTRIKLNAVLLRGLNDDQLPAFVDYVRQRPVSIRFIELMRTGCNKSYFERHHLRADIIADALVAAGWRCLPRSADAGPAVEYAHPNYQGRIGIIAPYARDFCAGCNRLRVTAQGDLRLCLFGHFGVPLRPMLQNDDQIPDLKAALSGQLGLKAAGHGLHQDDTGMTPHLASVGG